jgi:hypothetical protein
MGAWSEIIENGLGLRRALSEGKIRSDGSDIALRQLIKALYLMVAVAQDRLEEWTPRVTERNLESECGLSHHRSLYVCGIRVYTSR